MLLTIGRSQKRQDWNLNEFEKTFKLERNNNVRYNFKTEEFYISNNKTTYG